MENFGAGDGIERMAKALAPYLVDHWLAQEAPQNRSTATITTDAMLAFLGIEPDHNGEYNAQHRRDVRRAVGLLNRIVIDGDSYKERGRWITLRAVFLQVTSEVGDGSPTHGQTVPRAIAYTVGPWVDGYRSPGKRNMFLDALDVRAGLPATAGVVTR